LKVVVHIDRKLTAKCWVGSIDWLDGFIDMQAHALNALATSIGNDKIPHCQGWAAAEF